MSRGVVAQIENKLPSITGMGGRHYVAAAAFTGVVWVGWVLVVRYLLKGLFTYQVMSHSMSHNARLVIQGWMTEARGKKSFATRIWAPLVWLFSGRSPQLYSFQSSLPKLPVPSVKETLERYLKSMRPLLNDQEFEDFTKLAEEFETTIATRLQRYLQLKSWWSTNYVSDWWEDFVYLHCRYDSLHDSYCMTHIELIRDPIMVNSNFYGMDLLKVRPSSKQTARAATLIQGTRLPVYITRPKY